MRLFLNYKIKYKYGHRPTYSYSLLTVLFIAIAIIVFSGLTFLLALPNNNTKSSTKIPSNQQTIGHEKIKVSNEKSIISNPNVIIPNLTTQTILPTNIHENIITTIFWVGESADSSNGYIANSASAWDEQWINNYGGIDSPTNRNGYLASGFTPKENSFYFALPYSDLNIDGVRKASATNCPNSQNPTLVSYSWCKNSWIAIKNKDKIAYAQWQDVGPYEHDDMAYVFGQASPKNQYGQKAGLDVSPAIQNFLNLKDVDSTSWWFINQADVPEGPWKQIITSNKGTVVTQ